MRIKEIIVVEGRDDESAVKKAVDAEIIITNGFGIKEETFQRIEFAQQKKGAIIFTDPDHVGEQIRKRINSRIKGCKNAFLSREDACRNKNIGVENASSQNIKDALKKAKCITETSYPIFTIVHLHENKLTGTIDSAKRRQDLGKALGIGYANSKQLVQRLNNYSITKEQFYAAIKDLEDSNP